MATENWRYVPKSEGIIEKIIHGNIEFWRKRTEEFLETNPVCKSCGDELTNFSRKMLCWRCRCYKNNQDFLDRNPDYHKLYVQRKKQEEQEKCVLL